MSFSERGLRLVRALEKLTKDKPTYFDTRNVFSKIKIVAATDDKFKATMVVDSSMCNAYDCLHGGFIASVVDIMSLYALAAKTNGRMAYTTNLYINYINIASVGEKIIAETSAVKCGKTAIMESALYKENGDIIAKSTVCFKSGSDSNQKQAIEKIGFDVFETDK